MIRRTCGGCITLLLVVALQEQLGVKLEPDRAPVAATVIDALARPTEN